MFFLMSFNIVYYFTKTCNTFLLTVPFNIVPITIPRPSEQKPVKSPIIENEINLCHSKSWPVIKYVIVMKIIPKNICKENVSYKKKLRSPNSCFFSITDFYKNMKVYKRPNFQIRYLFACRKFTKFIYWIILLYTLF